MRPLQALIFDVDGTLAETEEAHRAAFNTAFAESGLGWIWSVKDYRQLLATTGGKERLRAFLDWPEAGGLALNEAEIRDLHALKTRHYLDILKQGQLPLRPGIADLIATARRHGLRLAVATTTSRPNVEALTQCCWGKPARQVFDVIAAGDEVAQKKPAGDVYALALARLGLRAEDCLAFEDSRNGILSARAVGLRVLLTPSVYTHGDDFTGADWVCASVEPDQLAGTPLFAQLAMA